MIKGLSCLHLERSRGGLRGQRHPIAGFDVRNGNRRFDGDTHNSGAHAKTLDQAVRPSGSTRLLHGSRRSACWPSKHAMVIGPTPPGTGVIAPATFATACVIDIADQLGLALALFRASTVDANVNHRRTFVDPVPGHHFRTPDSCTTISRAAHDIWQILGPANGRSSPYSCRPSKSCAIGLPTMLERPTTTAFIPTWLRGGRAASSSSPEACTAPWTSDQCPTGRR